MEEIKEDGGLRHYIQVLRWGPTQQRQTGRPFLKIIQIARMMRMSRQKVRRLLEDRCSIRPNQP